MNVDERILELHTRLAEEFRRRQSAETRLADVVRELASVKQENVALRQQLPVAFWPAS